MFNKSPLFKQKMNIIIMLNRLYKIYLRKTSNINLPKLCHNFYKFKFVNKIIKHSLCSPSRTRTHLSWFRSSGTTSVPWDQKNSTIGTINLYSINVFKFWILCFKFFYKFLHIFYFMIVIKYNYCFFL